MAGTCRTRSGDTWDAIAYREMGSGLYMDKLIAANPSHVDTFIFPAGVILEVPSVTVTTSETVPPWFGGD